MKRQNIFKMSILILAACLAGFASTAADRRPMALLVMFDGLRADALEAADLPAVESLRTGTWAADYHGAWTLAGQNVPDARPSSAANHTAIFTAVNAAKSGVYDNGQTKNGHYDAWPTWLTRVTQAVPGTKGLFIFSWSEGKQYPCTENVSFIHDSDANNGRRLAEILARPDAPDAIQYFIDLPDHGGHAQGFYPFARDYLQAIHTADADLGRALAAIKNRPTFKDEDWLILVTSDHGGYLRTHGVWGGHCTTVPLVLAGRRTPTGRLPGAPRHYDLTATALAHFGLDPAALNLDGRPLTLSAAPDSPRALTDGLAAYLNFADRKDGILRLTASTNAPCGFLVPNTDKLAFEHGGDFTATVWARLPAAQKGDPVIFSNKDWSRGIHPGIALVAAKKMEGAATPGVVFNAGRANGNRLDVGQFDAPAGQWVFHAVVRTADGVCHVYQGAPDGRLYRLAAPAADLVVATGLPFFLGQDGTGAYPHPLQGDLDEFALWTRALTHEDVRRIYAAGRRGVALGELLEASAP